MLTLFTDDRIADHTPFEKVQAQAFSIRERQKLSVIADHLVTEARFDETAFAWESIDRLAHQFKRYLGPIRLAVDFAASQANVPLIETVAILSEGFGEGKSLGHYSQKRFPIRFIPDHLKRYLYGQDTDGQKRFSHVLGRYVKPEPDDRVKSAGLVAWATPMGLGKRGDTSDIGYPALCGTSDNFIRLETLSEANDCISNAIAALPRFQYYDIGDTLHSSSDGQKFETRIHTIHARHSPKYFGLKKGVVSYTWVANPVPVSARIIGANDHERCMCSICLKTIRLTSSRKFIPRTHTAPTR